MGRYYDGDINGKFWFALQSSDCANRFGVEGETPQCLEYYFDDSDLHSVEKEIKAIKDTLGEKLKVIEEFFKNNNGYNDEMLSSAGISKDELSDYADLKLGEQIRNCIKIKGYCNFTAEL